MRTTTHAVAMLALAAVAAQAQVAPPIPEVQSNAAAPGGGASGQPSSATKKPETAAPGRGAAQTKAAASPSAREPSYKDLKYPPLRPIQVPGVAAFTLPNGMKLYLLEDHELPVVNAAARVRVGNLFDPPDKVGLATVTGMVMRSGGTKAKTGEELDLQLENIAASVESSIGESSGSVSFSALKENTGEVMSLFHDVMTAPEFRQDKIDLAKSQLRGSISRRNDDASGIAEREFTNTVYGKDTPYGWSMEYATLDRISRSDLQGFYQRYFFPANIALAVWGDFRADEMKARIEKLFADWTRQQPPVPEFPKVTAKPAPGVFLAVKKDVTQTFLSMGELGGDLRDKDYPALEIMGDILGGGFQSRLVQQVRTKMGNAYEISASWSAEYDHPGLFEIEAGTKSLSTVETIRAIQREVERIRTSEVTEAELTSAKETALNSLVFAFDTRSKTLGRMLTYEYYGYPKDFIQQYQKALEAVTRADVLRVAREHLDPARFTIVAVGNPDMFSQPLEALGGPVTSIDLTIAEAKVEVSKANAASLGLGRQLLERAQKAAGGADKLAEVKDFLRTSEFRLDARAGGQLVKATDRWIAPSHFRQDSLVPAGKIAAYTDGKAGWISTPQGWGPLAGTQLKQVQGDLFRLFFRLLLSDRIAGRTVNAVDDQTVEISGTEGEVVTLTFDPRTGLPQKIAYDSVHAAGPPVTVQDEYGDYRDVAGLKIPFKITITQGGQKFADITVTEAKINSGLQLEELGRRP
jgi:zinc protease